MSQLTPNSGFRELIKHVRMYAVTIFLAEAPSILTIHISALLYYTSEPVIIHLDMCVERFTALHMFLFLHFSYLCSDGSVCWSWSLCAFLWLGERSTLWILMSLQLHSFQSWEMNHNLTRQRMVKLQPFVSVVSNVIPPSSSRQPGRS